MDRYIFSDLAYENFGDKSGEKAKLFEEIRVSDDITLVRLSAGNNEKFGIGMCTTCFTPIIWSLNDECYAVLSKVLRAELRRFVEIMVGEIKRESAFLIVGLGNGELTPDALGVESVKRITVTGHYSDESLIKAKKPKIYATTPDVTGNTGINTADVVSAYVKLVEPELVFVIDSLCARNIDRLASTVQISDRGISPGGGIGRACGSISADVLKVPVISVGVPTVVNASTLITDIISASDGLGDCDIEKLLEGQRNFFVTPKEIDVVIRSSAMLLSDAINKALTVE